MSDLSSTLAYLRLVLGNLAAFTHGSCVVYPSEIFDPTKVVDALLADKYVGGSFQSLRLTLLTECRTFI